MSSIRSSVFVSVLSLAFAALASAQAPPLGPRSFAPMDHGGEIGVDVRRLDDLGLLAELQRSPIAMLGAKFRDTFGFSIEELDRVSFFIKELRGESGGRRGEESVWVFEGSDKVGLGTVELEGERTSVGEVKFLDSRIGQFCSPRAGLLVLDPKGAQAQRLEQLVRGTAKPGAPMPELLELTARPGSIAWVARVIPDRREEWGMLIPGMGSDWATDEDPPRAIALRVTEDPKTHALAVTLLVRFVNGEVGPARLQSHLEPALETARSDPQLKPFRALFDGVTTKISGRDLEAVLALGEGRAAIGKLSQFAILVASTGMSTRQQELEIVEFDDVTPQAPEPAPQPAPAPQPTERRR